MVPIASEINAWAPAARPYLLAFDLSDARDRRRLETWMKGLGFVQTQYSARVGWLTPGEVRRFREKLSQLKEAHHVLLLPLGERLPKAIVEGEPLGISQKAWGNLPAQGPLILVGGP